YDLRLVKIGEPRLLWRSQANQGVGELAVDPAAATVALVEGLDFRKRKTIRLMHADTGVTTREIEMDSSAWRPHFRNASELIVSCGDGTVRLYNLDEATETKRFNDHEKKGHYRQTPLTLMEVAADGEVIVTATAEDVAAPVVARDLRCNARKRVTKSKPTD